MIQVAARQAITSGDSRSARLATTAAGELGMSGNLEQLGAEGNHYATRWRVLGAYFPALYPTCVRSLGAGFCFDVGRGVAAFSPFAFGQLATSIGLAASIAWCALGFVLAAVVMWWMPEAD